MHIVLASERATPRAVLFDRDGTLIVNVADLADPADVQPMPDARATLDALRRNGILVGVVSNQSGVARGLISIDALERVNARVEALLGPFDTWQVCPHDRDEGCVCRKPGPGLVLAAAAALGVQPTECVVIGDIVTDLEAGRRAGATGVLVPNEGTLPVEVDHAHERAAVAGTLDEAVRHVFGVLP